MAIFGSSPVYHAKYFRVSPLTLLFRTSYFKPTLKPPCNTHFLKYEGSKFPLKQAYHFFTRQFCEMKIAFQKLNGPLLLLLKKVCKRSYLCLGKKLDFKRQFMNFIQCEKTETFPALCEHTICHWVFLSRNKKSPERDAFTFEQVCRPMKKLKR